MADQTTQRIFVAIEAGDVPAARALLEADAGLANVWHLDAAVYDNRPLAYAAGRGRLELCRLLVERGAEVYTNPMNSYPAVMYAAWNGHGDVVNYFLQDIPAKADGTNGLGVTIHLAARQGWASIVRQHIERDPLSVHQRGLLGDTPLHWSSHNNHAGIVTMLLDAGADIEADEINGYGGKPLHWASEHAPEVVDLLLSRGADVNSRNIRRESALFSVTPLIMNARQKDDCSEVTRRLIDAGADPLAVDEQGRTALDHARERGLTKIIAVLETR